MTDAGPDYRPFLAALPKCEHHLHIEGSLSPSLLFSLSARNAIALPSAISDIAYANVAALEARYKAFTSLDDFLAYYDRASRVLIKREDFADLSYAYMQKASEDGIAHTEISFDLQTHTQRGIAVETVVKGLNDGLKKGEKEFGALCCGWGALRCTRENPTDPCVHADSLASGEPCRITLGTYN